MKNIKIGFRFSKQYQSLGRKYWKSYEVVGSSYGLTGYSSPNFKTRKDILKLKKYVQIIDLPSLEVEDSQLSIKWKPLKELQNEIEEDMKLSLEFRKYKIDNYGK